MKIIIATHNPKKRDELQAILGEYLPQLEILTLDNFPEVKEPVEDGLTMAENAIIKAESAMKEIGLWCIADDGGLEIDALGGEPGIHSKRFAGEQTPFTEKMNIILEKMQSTPDHERSARYRCAIALAIPGEEPKVFEDTFEGFMTHKPEGSGGFGYDPIFLIPGKNCTMAQLTPKEKNAISHRAKAMAKLGEYLRNELMNRTF